MLIAAAVRAPTSVAIALLTFAVSAASLVKSPVVRRLSACRCDAQAARSAAAVAAAAALSMLRLDGFIPSGLASFPVLYLPFGFVLADAVAFLDLADELIAVARHLVELVVGKLAPLLLQLAFHLLPVALDAIPVHAFLLLNNP